MTDIQPGDFAVVPVQGIVGKLIRIGQWLNGNGYRNYEHAYVVVDNDQIVEAEPGGAILSTDNRYTGRSPLYGTSKVVPTNEQRSAVVEAAKGFVGTPYSFVDYVFLALKRLNIKVPFLTERVIDSKHMICSQLVVEAYRAAGIDLFPGKLSCEVTPGDLANLILIR